MAPSTYSRSRGIAQTTARKSGASKTPRWEQQPEARNILRAELAVQDDEPADLYQRIRRHIDPLDGVDLALPDREPPRAPCPRPMIVLDTTVVSEAFRLRPHRSVATWPASRPSSSLSVTTITQAELLDGCTCCRPASADDFKDCGIGILDP